MQSHLSQVSIIMANVQLPPPCIRDLSDVEQATSEANQMLQSETATLNAKVQEECKGLKPELLRSFMIVRQNLVSSRTTSFIDYRGKSL